MKQLYPDLQIKIHVIICFFFFKQDMEVSVFELVQILDNVVSHRKYFEKFEHRHIIFIYFSLGISCVLSLSCRV